jgi:hypothetical protein
VSEAINPPEPIAAEIPSGPGPRRRVAISAIVVAFLIVAGFLWSRQSRSSIAPPPTPAPAPAAASPIPGPATPPPPRGTVTATMTLVDLTPAARIQAEKFRCVCGCRLSLGECYCAKTPGSVEMKRFLQGLVGQGLAPAEIEKAMVGKYGASVAP